ncbi:MAG: diaminopimelate epimerase [Proteobacteria bacterium]|nr:diaminopimelate epimerase [Pseudomonadota bacterium]MBU1740629.1 diaminopimelate epimerase [Pseudomonadota bacterium]
MSPDGLEFYKLSGSGNDFIIIDNRPGVVDEASMVPLARALCPRGRSVGADGLILLEASSRVDFKWRFFNADGSEAEMCGNGGRCAARVAHMIGLAPEQMVFETRAGDIRATILPGEVKLEMVPPQGLRLDYPVAVDGREVVVSSLNTGVPHVVIWVDDLDGAPVLALGPKIRYHQTYQPAGTNVNFVTMEDEKQLAIRTYERGVENETLACGTGAVAAALIGGVTGRVKSPAGMKTRGGEVLTVHFDVDGGIFKEVYLQGGARLIYRGVLSAEAWEV